MRVYVNVDGFKKLGESVPGALRRKRGEEIDARVLEMGFKGVGKGKDENGEFIDYVLKRGTTLKGVYDFMGAFPIDAVTFHPDDVTKLGGVTPLTLGLAADLENGAAHDVGLELLTADEVREAFRNAQIHTLGRSD